jgi:hypothetical protein
MRRALLLGGALAALATGWVLAAAPIVNETVAIVDPFTPSQQAGVDGAGNLKVNCTTGCSAGSGTGANNADSVAPVSTGLGQSQSFLFGFDGTNWDRLRLDGSDNLKVNCTTGCSAGTAGNNADGVATVTTGLGQTQGYGYAFNGTSWDRLEDDASKNLKVNVNAALPAGTNTVGNVGLAPQTGGGLSISSTQVANNTTAIVIKSGAGQLYGLELYNNSATIAYVKLYNATSEICGSGTPVQRAMIPANAAGAGAISNNVNGIAYSTGIAMCVTGGFTDSDTTAPSASTYIVNVLYK